MGFFDQLVNTIVSLPKTAGDTFRVLVTQPTVSIAKTGLNQFQNVFAGPSASGHATATPQPFNQSGGGLSNNPVRDNFPYSPDVIGAAGGLGPGTTGMNPPWGPAGSPTLGTPGLRSPTVGTPGLTINYPAPSAPAVQLPGTMDTGGGADSSTVVILIVVAVVVVVGIVLLVKK